MNKFKIYLRTKSDIEPMIETYTKTFSGKVIKKSFINKNDVSLNIKDPKDKFINFAYLEILGDLNILIAHHKDEMPHWGYSQDTVITLDSKEKYDAIYNNLKHSKDFKMIYDTLAQSWGTQISKWEDKYGFNWIIESKI